jgi:hypothetical protein
MRSHSSTRMDGQCPCLSSWINESLCARRPARAASASVSNPVLRSVTVRANNCSRHSSKAAPVGRLEQMQDGVAEGVGVTSRFRVAQFSRHGGYRAIDRRLGGRFASLRRLQVEIQLANQPRERQVAILLDTTARVQPRPAGFRRHREPVARDLRARLLTPIPAFPRRG